MHDGRVCCGSSCAAATGAPGTLGALVRRANDDKLYMMSCNHVIAACNQVPIGIPILSPAPLDAQPFGDLPRAIARLSHAIPLRSGVPGIEDPCEQDVALAALLDEALVSSKQGGSGGFDTPVDIADLKSGMKVKKFGRSSGLTHGVVESVVEGPWAIPCVTKKFKGSFWFKNFAQVVGTCKAFAIPGDSGSLVVTEDGTAAVGLVFSSYGGGEATQILPIRSVLGALGATLVNGHHI